MLQTRTSRWLAGTALLCAVLLAGAYFLLVGPKRDEAAALRDEDASSQQRNATLQIQLRQLAADYAKLPDRQAELAAVQQQLPATADIPRLVRDLDGLARNSGVQLQSLTPGTPAYLTTATGTAATGTVATGTVATGAAGTARRVVQIPITLTLHGDYYAQLTFLRQLQHTVSRAVLVSSLQIVGAQGGTTPGQVDVTLSGSVFTLPGIATTTTGGQIMSQQVPIYNPAAATESFSASRPTPVGRPSAARFSRTQLVLATSGVLAVLAAGLVAVLLTSSGDSDLGAGPRPVVRASGTAAPTSSPSSDDASASVVPGSGARNPFVSPAGGRGAGAVGAPVPTVTVTQTVTASASAAAAPLYVGLYGWTGTKAVLRVNTAPYTVAPGATFGQYFQFVAPITVGSLQCAKILFGDAASTVCPGEVKQVR